MGFLLLVLVFDVKAAPFLYRFMVLYPPSRQFSSLLTRPPALLFAFLPGVETFARRRPFTPMWTLVDSGVGLSVGQLGGVRPSSARDVTTSVTRGDVPRLRDVDQ